MNTPDHEILRWLHSRESFVILSHVRPDGDAYGSSIGLALSLCDAGKKVLVCNEDGLNPQYRFLPGGEALQITPEIPPPEETGLIAIDTATQDRLGGRFAGWKKIPDLNIDHHISNTLYGRMNYIDADSPASAQIVHDLIQRLKLPMTRAIAENLFVGLSMDTGSFRYRQTTARTFEVAASLIRAGADPTDLAQLCYQNYSPSRLLLLKGALNDLHFACNHRIAYYHLTRRLFEETGAHRDETEGLLEYFQMVGSVEVAFVLEEVAPDITRVSLRSRGKIDVQEIAAGFGGGGHRLAAGIRANLSVPDLENRLLRVLEEKLNPTR